jgi:hypothetical protein
MAHASRWLAAEGLGVGDLTPVKVGEFLVHRRGLGYVLWLSPKGMQPMLDYLRGIGVLDTPAPAVAVSETELLLRDYEEFWSANVGWRWERSTATCTWLACSARPVPSTASCGWTACRRAR